MSEDDSGLDEGWRKLEQGNYAGAHQQAEAELREDPENPDALLLLGACHRWEGNLEEAIEVFERAGEADSEWSEPELWMAEIYAQEMDSPEQALDHAALALDRAEEEDEFLDALVLKAGIEIHMGRTKAAQATLSELPPASDLELQAELAIDLAYLFLEAEMGKQAELRFRQIVERDEENAEAWYGLGLCAEDSGDESAKRSAWQRVLDLDRKSPIESPHMSEAEMSEIAEQALKELPETARKLIANVPILIADLPAAGEVEQGLDPRLLGLFEGATYAEASSMGGTPQVTQILLFRKNLERMALDPEDMREQIRITLLHETGHFFGMSEADLADVGLD